MIEQWFTQTEWQGIEFADLGVPLDADERASADFYSAFYRALTRRYPTYEALPAYWREVKRETARNLAVLIPPEARVLSCGAGIGYTEHVLATEFGMRNLVLWDWAPTAATYATDSRLTYVNDLGGESGRNAPIQYDVIYLCQVLYGMSTSEAVGFLSQLRPMIKPGGSLVLVNTSPIGAENGDQLSATQRPGGRMRIVGHSLSSATWWKRRIAAASGARVPEQGWGWARDNEAVAEILVSSGYGGLTFSTGAHQSFVVAGSETALDSQPTDSPRGT